MHNEVCVWTESTASLFFSSRFALAKSRRKWDRVRVCIEQGLFDYTAAQCHATSAKYRDHVSGLHRMAIRLEAQLIECSRPPT